MRRLIWPVLFLLLMLVQGAASAFYTGWLAFDLPLLALYAFACASLYSVQSPATGLVLSYSRYGMD